MCPFTGKIIAQIDRNTSDLVEMWYWIYFIGFFFGRRKFYEWGILSWDLRTHVKFKYKWNFLCTFDVKFYSNDRKPDLFLTYLKLSISKIIFSSPSGKMDTDFFTFCLILKRKKNNKNLLRWGSNSQTLGLKPTVVTTTLYYSLLISMEQMFNLLNCMLHDAT